MVLGTMFVQDVVIVNDGLGQVILKKSLVTSVRNADMKYNGYRVVSQIGKIIRKNKPCVNMLLYENIRSEVEQFLKEVDK